jgi:hypothetical protein
MPRDNPVKLPDQANDHLPDKAVEHLPEAVQPPQNLIFDDPTIAFETLVGTPEKDVFVIDTQTALVPLQESTVILDFDQNQDELVFVNHDPHAIDFTQELVNLGEDTIGDLEFRFYDQNAPQLYDSVLVENIDFPGVFSWFTYPDNPYQWDLM